MGEKRNANVIFNKNGNGFDTTKIALPVPWIKNMGIDENNKKVNLYFNENKIIIEKGEIKMFKVICFNDIFRKDILEKHGANEYYHYADFSTTSNLNEWDFATKKEAIEYAKEAYKKDNEKYSVNNGSIYLTRYDVLDCSKDEDNPENIESFGLSLQEFENIYNK